MSFAITSPRGSPLLPKRRPNPIITVTNAKTSTTARTSMRMSANTTRQQLAWVITSPCLSSSSPSRTRWRAGSSTTCQLHPSSSASSSFPSSFSSRSFLCGSPNIFHSRRRPRTHIPAVTATAQPQPQPQKAPNDNDQDPRAVNGTALFYAALIAAQLLPFSPKTSGLAGDLVYFSVTALSCIVIGVRRAPLEPLELSAPLSKTQVIAAPFTASIFLFGSYLLLKYTTVDISLLFNVITTLGGALCLKECLDPVFYSLFQSIGIPDPEIIPAGQPSSPSPPAGGDANGSTQTSTTANTDIAPNTSPQQEQKQEGKEFLQPAFTASNLAASLIAVGTIAAYLLKLPPSFVFSNAIAVALATRVLSLIRPSSFLVASGLLVGLFFYDIFWVYGSEVMVSVATSIDTPGKLLFPRDPGTSGINYPYAILGLGDICVPGIFVSIAQSLDMKLAPDVPRSKQPYFKGSIAAYIVALFACFFANFQTNAAQPALLYLVPALIGSSLAVGAYRGELKDVISFSDDDDDGKPSVDASK